MTTIRPDSSWVSPTRRNTSADRMWASKFRVLACFREKYHAGQGDWDRHWTDEEIATALTMGKRPDGRQLAPIMPYPSFINMTKEDVAAIIAFLRSIPAVKNEVAGPFKPGEKVSIFTFRVLPLARRSPKRLSDRVSTSRKSGERDSELHCANWSYSAVT